MMPSMIKRVGGAIAAAALLATSACGGSSGTDTAALSKALDKGVTVTAFGGSTKVDLDKKAADCVAKTLGDSEISAKTLDQIAKPTKDYRAPSADAKALDSEDKALQKCLGDKTPNPLISRPSAAQIEAAFTKGVKGYVFGSQNEVKVEADKAKCIATALEDSEVSNLTINKLLAQGQDYTAPEADVAAFKAITTELNKCVKPEGAAPAPSPSPKKKKP